MQVLVVEEHNDKSQIAKNCTYSQWFEAAEDDDIH